MRQSLAEITAVDPVGPFACVRIAAPDIARALEPGRAVLATLTRDYVRRAWWPCAIDAGRFSILADAVEAACFRPGDRVDLLGPIGHGFQVDEPSRSLLLVASGAGADLGPLLPLIDRALAERRSVTLAYAAPSIEAAYPVAALPPAIEVVRAIGADLIDLLGDAITWADQVFACGSVDFAARLAGQIQSIRVRVPRGFAQVLHMRPMPCGVGACGACGTRSRLACVDGPVFRLPHGRQDTKRP